MRTILLIMSFWALTATWSYGQVKPAEAEPATYRQRVLDMRVRQAVTEQARGKAVESGRRLFGADERWSEAVDHIFAGSFFIPTKFKIGDWGCSKHVFKVLGKVSDNECLVLPTYKEADVMLLRGFDMSKVTDGVEFILQYLVIIQDTHSYTTAAGAKKTVLVLERNDKKFHEMAEAAGKKVINDRRISRKATGDPLARPWKDPTGKILAVARLIVYKGGEAHLELRDGTTMTVPLRGLSQEAQEWIREELKRQRGRR